MVINSKCFFFLVFMFVPFSQVYADTDHPDQQSHLSFEELRDLKESDLEKEDVREFSEDSSSMDDQRLLAVREAAMVVASQHGYVKRLNKIKERFMELEDSLDKQWDFSLLMRLAHGEQNGQYLIPPAIQEVEDVRKISEDRMTITHSEKVFKIIRPERLALNPPNWRSYLIKDQDVDTTLPSKALFPETPEEQEAWDKAMQEGWVAGEEHAEREMNYRIRRMSNEFQGMVRYLRLIEQDKVEKTKVAYSHEDVQSGSEEMHQNKHVFNIAVPSSFNDDVEDWEPILLTPRDSFSFPIEKGSEVDLMDRKQK